MSDVVSVEYELTAEDWIAATESYVRGLRRYRRTMRAVRLLFGVIIAILVLLFLWDGALASAAVLAVLGAGWVSVIPAVTRRNQRRALQKAADEGIARGTFGRHRVALTDEGVLDSAEGYDWLIHWSAVERVEDSGRALLVYNGAHSFLTIPLTAFPDRATFEAFSERFFRGLDKAGRLSALTDPEAEGRGASEAPRP